MSGDSDRKDGCHERNQSDDYRDEKGGLLVIWVRQW